MAKGIVIYYSRTGNTKQMAEIIAKGMNESGLSTECKSVEDIKPEDFRFIFEIVYGRSVTAEDEENWEGGTPPPKLKFD